MFFGPGNCLDNDSDGFHFIGYAETVNPVKQPSDLLSWKVINGLDNPILSTDTVTDPSGPRPYPLYPPVVNVSGADALTPTQVFPFVPPVVKPPLVTPPGGYNLNFFSGRVYDPRRKNDHDCLCWLQHATAKQQSGRLSHVGRFQLRVPAGYFSPN